MSFFLLLFNPTPPRPQSNLILIYDLYTVRDSHAHEIALSFNHSPSFFALISKKPQTLPVTIF